MKACILLLFASFFFDLTAQDDPSNSIAKVTGYGSKEEIGGGIVTGWSRSDNIVFLVTAYHVVQHSDSITVEFRSRRKEFSAELFNVDSVLDLAILKVSIAGVSISFDPQVIAESSDFQLSLVKIIGHPQGSSWVLEAAKFLNDVEPSRFTVSNETINKRGQGHGFSGGGVFTKNNRLMGMMLDNRSHDAIAISIFEITTFLNKRKIYTNLLIPPKTNLASLAIIGAGTALILVSVLHFENKSKDLYSVYEEHRFPSDPIYGSMGTSREDVYNEANSKHKTAVLIGAAGGAVLVAGSYILIRKLSKQSKERKNDGLAVIPYFDIPGYALSTGNSFSLGITLRF